MPKQKLKATRHPGVYRRSTDSRYVVRGTARTAEGKMVNRKRLLPAGTTEAEAEQAALALRKQAQREAMGISTPTPLPLATTRGRGVETVEDYAHRWLDEKRRRLKPGTFKRYEDEMMRRLLPRLGHLPLADFCRGALESWVAWAEHQVQADGSPYTEATLQSWWRTLATMARDLAADFDLPDPTRRVRPPQAPTVPPKRERRTLTREQLRGLLAAAAEVVPSRYAEILTLAWTGMRPGELYALKWDCVFFDEEKIVVRRSISAGQLTETTKTKAAREVPMLPELAAVLADQRKQLIADQHRGLRSGLVFPSEVGRPRFTTTLKKPLALASEVAGLSFVAGPQVLRRTFNTLAVTAGVERIVLWSIVGHSSEAMTRRYAGVPMNDKAAVVHRMFAEQEQE